jgi:hypothetical protein
LNQASIPPRHRRTSRKRFAKIAFLLFVAGIILLLFAVYQLLYILKPNTERVPYDFSGVEQPIFYMGEMYPEGARGEGGSLQLPLSFVQRALDSAIVYEEASESVILTTGQKVLRMKTDQLTAWINEQPFQLSFPAENIGGQIYVPAEPLKELYNIHIEQAEDTKAVLIWKAGAALQRGKVLAHGGDPQKGTVLRLRDSVKAPIIADLKPGDEVIILQEAPDGWYQVQLQNGYVGYARKESIMLDRLEIKENLRDEKPFVAWKPTGGKINLTWEHVLKPGVHPDLSQIGMMPGLNVISPTWFHLENGNGDIKNYASSAYVQWAHERGYQVWALFSNSFDPDITSQALSAYDTRIRMIKQLLGFAEMYKLDGINIDFENVYPEDKDKLTQFVRELTPFMHEQGLVVSIDVTIRGGSPMWSLFYDREELGKIVDYMIVMTYDEHWASSPKAGSVASLPWAEKGIVDIMEEDRVPASKLLLGVPYYTRIWTEEYVGGKKKVTSEARGMEYVQDLIAEKNLTPVFLEDVGQHYVEYEEGGKTKKIWIEDSVSMKSRIELVKKYDLAGVASWRRGFESPDIWETIQETLN